MSDLESIPTRVYCGVTTGDGAADGTSIVDEKRKGARLDLDRASFYLFIKGDLKHNMYSPHRILFDTDGEIWTGRPLGGRGLNPPVPAGYEYEIFETPSDRLPIEHAREAARQRRLRDGDS